MKSLLIAATALRLMLLTGCSGDTVPQDQPRESQEVSPMQAVDHKTIEFTTITGEPTSLDDYKGKVVLLVNTASKCGYTEQYAGLEKLYQEKRGDGFVILGFPANNFGGQEPGTNEEILNFCQTTFGVSFPMMAKISVKGEDIHPLYKYLTMESPHPGEITWNFNKFLLDRDGNVVARYDSKITPDDSKLLAQIDDLL